MIVLGLSKGGFTGLSVLGDADAVAGDIAGRAAAIILPVLIVGDWVGVWAFRRDFSSRNLFILIPASLIGIAAGMAARRARQRGCGPACGRRDLDRLRLLHAAARPARSRRVEKPGVPGGVFWGSIAGFTSFISHAGGPPFQVYVLPQNLKPRVFAGTATMFFAAVNLIKVPPYFLLGQFSRENMKVSLALFPLAILSTLAGVWLVRRFEAERFYKIILALTFLIGVKLTYDALQALV